MRINLFKRLWLLLLSVGPGIFCIGYTIGTGSVTSMIKSGSQYGLQLLWVLFLSAFFAWILMESFGRFAVVTGNTAINSFKNKLKWGKFWAVITIIGVVMGQWSALSGILGLTSNAIYEVVRLFFPIINESNYWAVLGIAIALIVIMYAFLLVGKYSFFEKLLVIFVTIMGISFILSMFIVLPSPAEIARGFIPRIPPGGNLMVAAFVGTTMSAPTFIVRPLIVKEKGWKKSNMKDQRRDALTSAIFLFVISATIMIAATGALFHEGKIVTKVLDMVYALEPVAGKFAVVVFMFGAMSAGLSSIFPILMVLPLLIGDYRQGKMDLKSPTFKLLAAVACLVGLVVPVLGANPIMAQIATQVATVFILPVVISGIIILINRKSLMGEHKANLFLNIALFAALAFSLVISYTGILGLNEYFTKL
ncbi:MAG: Nramp family divalent metal transporter [Prolixibacteraceae bacterium]|jgi:manganese transport protein|nr:Nramp family divalent metal transporter [Prolixibacteraceae bacterium]MBT6005397.1 Nramp family divalent metal transporter [Prolixibacteraceae bacterium]MBT6766099.1 Nramp family divalent metal transporter [Prolixibacteraceae bacterium]MBT6996853.1 Nramp family divalent metal transporter [Prolixibacteraceae bacterium]MBT7395264.1 Nramp family divalent metal transporter [Prolixibacteraceae bacterium]